MSRVRRGVLSLRVVRQMLTWPHKSYTCGNDKFYLLIQYLHPWCKGTQVSRKICGRCSSLGGVRVPWMLTWCRISPGRWRSRRLLKGWMREKMEDVRGPRRAGCHVLTAFHWWCEGDKLATMGVVTCCEGCSNMLVVHLSALSCAVSLSVNLFSSLPSWAVCAKWEGDGGVEGCVCYCVICLVKR